MPSLRSSALAIIPIINMIAEDWKTPKNMQEKNIMIRQAQYARIIITCAFCIMGVGGFFIIILPCFGISMRLTTNITDPGRPMPLQTHYIYDVTKKPQYELTFISQSIYIIVAIMSYSGIDNFLGLLVFHICGQLEILKKNLSSLDKCMDCQKILKKCVMRHVRLLRAIKVIEETYNITLLVLFVYFGLLFAFYGFRIICLFEEENNLSVVHLIYFISNIINLFVHMCLYCVLGEILMTKCNEIYYAAYNNKWYSVDLKTTKNLIHLFIRGTKPVYLTAGKIFPMTMATFCGVKIIKFPT
ncbi:odorant receptor 4-like [Cardiocondyla obscurior]|uniref:odorant receptor 4-like n=1 Tax=Cardiocondyla obscurior TaxID=286306 RepID=UPI00396560C7